MTAPAEPERAARRRRLWLAPALAVVLGVALLYVLVPALAGIDETWSRIKQGDPWWLACALVLELASFGGYVVLFRCVFKTPDDRFGWRESYLVTMAGLAATRLFGSAGIGGIALTAWALRRAGMARAEVLARMTTFLVLLYAVFMVAIVVGGFGLRVGLFDGPDPWALTVVPAAFAATVIVLALAITLVPADLRERVGRTRPGERRWVQILTEAPVAVAGGVRGALALVRRRDPRVLGAVAWWGFDMAVLWACFHAFGEPPPTAVLVTAYFVGQLGNTLPLPGGIGGVDGAMIGALIGFGVSHTLAIVAVLSYRLFAFWLPTLPGALAYLRLRRIMEEWGPEEAEAPA